jgi:hypothetical protein
MFFHGEGACVCVVILDQALWADRRVFMDSIMRASALAGKANRTYLALPKAAASVADARLFHDRGIGLFTYDQRNVDEVLPARYFETAAVTQQEANRNATGQVENEIRELRAQFDMLERTVQHLSEQLVASREMRPAQDLVSTLSSPSSLSDIGAVGNLPTFFAGNPWLEVLSRRGRGEQTIAG